MIVLDFFHIDSQHNSEYDKKKFKKVIVGKVEVCTFAPAFGREVGEVEAPGAEFFDRLRPAQQGGLGYRRGAWPSVG